jgi:hypothetical protein
MLIETQREAIPIQIGAFKEYQRSPRLNKPLRMNYDTFTMVDVQSPFAS